MTTRPRVVDTSAWIEWLIGSPTGQRIGRALPRLAECVVPTIVQLELSKWLTRHLGEERTDQVLAYTMKCVVIPLDTGLAISAAEIHRLHRLATADAIVYATARARGAELLTCDAHFDGLADVVLVKKAA